MSWPTTPDTTLADRVYLAIRARILDADMAPGAFVREEEMSRSLGVSRTPVREALGRLASEGFLERIPHRGFRVPEQALGELLELHPIVSSLELLGDLRSQINRLELWFYSQQARTDESVHEHEDLIRALESGNRERALSLLQHDMSLTYERLKESRGLETPVDPAVPVVALHDP